MSLPTNSRAVDHIGTTEVLEQKALALKAKSKSMVAKNELLQGRLDASLREIEVKQLRYTKQVATVEHVDKTQPRLWCDDEDMVVRSRIGGCWNTCR